MLRILEELLLRDVEHDGLLQDPEREQSAHFNKSIVQEGAKERESAENRISRYLLFALAPSLTDQEEIVLS